MTEAHDSPRIRYAQRRRERTSNQVPLLAPTWSDSFGGGGVPLKDLTSFVSTASDIWDRSHATAIHTTHHREEGRCQLPSTDQGPSFSRDNNSGTPLSETWYNVLNSLSIPQSLSQAITHRSTKQQKQDWQIARRAVNSIATALPDTVELLKLSRPAQHFFKVIKSSVHPKRGQMSSTEYVKQSIGSRARRDRPSVPDTTLRQLIFEDKVALREATTSIKMSSVGRMLRELERNPTMDNKALLGTLNVPVRSAIQMLMREG